MNKDSMNLIIKLETTLNNSTKNFIINNVKEKEYNFVPDLIVSSHLSSMINLLQEIYLDDIEKMECIHEIINKLKFLFDLEITEHNIKNEEKINETH
jgi:hypothetical protein